MDIYQYLQPLTNAFYNNRNKEQAVRMSAYLRNHFAFLGLKKPERATLQKQFFKYHGWPSHNHIPGVVDHLWQMQEREFQYVALDILETYTKAPSVEALEFYRKLITQKSWWDTVDMLAPKAVGNYFLVYPEDYEMQAHCWINDPNRWIRRSALLFQLKYKEKTDKDLLASLIKKCIHSNEFFIQKAMGWILREYSKENPEWVKQFVASNQLPSLSKREALKWLKNKNML